MLMIPRGLRALAAASAFSQPIAAVFGEPLETGGRSVDGPSTPSALIGRPDQRFDLIGLERSVAHRLEEGDEFRLPLRALLAHGERLFVANWTVQEGGGRPFSKGTGAPLVNQARPLQFPRNFNRLSAPDANSCAGCHNAPLVGGDGDIVTNVFVLAQRFDFATFDALDGMPTAGALDESGAHVTLQSIGNSRATVGMSGSGFIEMLARGMTADLQAIRDGIAPGTEAALTSKGVSFGSLARHSDGHWDVTRVVGLAAPSLVSQGASAPPSLLIRPFHQAGQVISLRQFTNNAFNHHHGIQAAERFGAGVDADGDGFADELTRSEVTAATVFQAAMAVPGRVIPNDPRIEAAVREGERRFEEIGCAACHVPSLPLDDNGWLYVEPNPYNPPGNLQPGDAPDFVVDLTAEDLPLPRLQANRAGVVEVPAYTDLKLHDLCDGADDPNREPLDMGEPSGSLAFFAGNCRFITRKLWGAGSTAPYFHHGQLTTLRDAILAHGGEAAGSRAAFRALAPFEQGAVVEFLKSLQILPPGTPDLVVDEYGRRKHWSPAASVR
jgi:hypothetical protein